MLENYIGEEVTINFTQIDFLIKPFRFALYDTWKRNHGLFTTTRLCTSRVGLMSEGDVVYTQD